jgi:hypothetical protein
MRLEKNERFVKEYSEFDRKISKISDDRIKKDMTQLLNQLLGEVRELDRKHQDLVISANVLSNATENREKLQTIRKKIVTRIQECERSGLITE